MANASIFDAVKRRTVRQPDNPLDKSTVISIYPQDIHSHNETLQPGKWTIKAGDSLNPSLTTILPSSWWKDVDPDQELIEIPVSSLLVAASIIDDYCTGLYCCDMAEIRPGLFWLPGEKTLEQIRKENKTLLNLAEQRQKNWFNELVKQADAVWATSNGNPRAIGRLEKLAAQHLGIQREWMKSTIQSELIKCVACGNLRDANFPICSSCKTVIDVAKAKTLGLVTSA